MFKNDLTNINLLLVRVNLTLNFRLKFSKNLFFNSKISLMHRSIFKRDFRFKFSFKSPLLCFMIIKKNIAQERDNI